jgi:putative transposase
MPKTTTRPKGQRRYTHEQRSAVLADLAELGAAASAAKHEVPLSTVYQWRAKQREAAGEVTERPNAAHSPVEVPPKPKPNPPTSPTPPTPPTPPPSTPSPTDPTETATPPELTARIDETPKPNRNVAKRYTPSEKARAIELADSRGVAIAATELGMSRFAIYEWLGKLKDAPHEAITSGPAPSEIEVQRDAEILNQYRSHPGLGPSQIRNQLRRQSIKVGIKTVRRVMESAGYRPPKVDTRPHDRRYESVRPNHLWHLDFVHKNINQANAFTLILLDDRSRFVVGHGVDDAERANMVIDTFEQAVQRHGKPEMVMHDRGSAFWSWRGISRFTKLLTELNIDQIVAEDKEHNGKVEVFNANLAKELFNVQRFYDLAEMKRRLATHLHWYNHVRTHHAHGGLLVPADHYYGRADEVLARIEAGAGPEADELCLRDRRLSMFSVASENGEVIVSIMGQRLSLGKFSGTR